MIVLGIGGGFGHDPAAALVIDGEIIAACEEERFTRQKGALRQPPKHSVQACLDSASITLSDVDCLALGWNPALAPHDYRLTESLDALLRSSRFAGDRCPPIEHVDHHAAHGALAYHTSGFAEASVVVVDGQGEDVSSTIYAAKEGTLREIQRFGIPDSLGDFFAAVSRYLGFPPGSAGKTMGLAALGSVTYDFPEIDLVEGGYAVRMAGATKADRRAGWLERLGRTFGPPGDPAFRMDPVSGLLRRGGTLPPHLRDAAASAQAALERTMVHLARVAIEATQSRNLVLSGGVALNCSSNGRIRAALGDVELFVHGAAHDGGTALGAALAVSRGPSMPVRLRERQLFLGPELDVGPACDRARSLGLKVVTPKEGAAIRTAALLGRGQIGGWFQGKAEYGPRALGARSIVARADDVEIARRVNAIKGREEWRPLAPAMTSSLIDEIGFDRNGLDFMIEARWLPAESERPELAGVLHADRSVRPLLVEDRHPFAPLLSALYERSGIQATINTSFNLEHEPIVNSPLDALRTFVASGLDFMVMDTVVLEKV